MATEGGETPDTTTTTTKATTTTTTTTTTKATTTTTTTSASTTTTTTKGSTSTTKSTSKTTKKSTKKTSSTTKASSTTGSTTTTTAKVVQGQVAGGSVTFKRSNSKRVPVGKSTTLYLTVSDVSGSYATIFTVNDTSVVSLEKINNQSVRVTGIKEGTVTVTATINGRTAQYVLTVGDAPVTQATSARPANPGEEPDEEPVESIVTDEIELDLFSTPENDQLAEYIEESQQTSAGDILLGIIGFAAIFGGFGVVLSVIFRNRSPKLNLYPGSRRRFNSTGSSGGRRRKRLLPDHYYRSNDKF